jgi:hypothetical protein
LAILQSKENSTITKLNAFINNPDAWRVLGANHELTPQEIRAKLSEIFPDGAPTIQSLVEKKFPTMEMALEELNNSIKPLRMYINHIKPNRTQISISLFGIKIPSSIQGTILDPYNEAGVWERQGATNYVVLRSPIDEKQILDVLNTLSPGDRERVVNILNHAYGITGNIGNLLKLPSLSNFLNFTDDELLAMKSTPEGKKLTRAILEDFFSQETPSIAGWPNILKKSILEVLTDKDKKLTILLGALKQADRDIDSWAMDGINNMPGLTRLDKQPIFDMVQHKPIAISEFGDKGAPITKILNTLVKEQILEKAPSEDGIFKVRLAVPVLTPEIEKKIRIISADLILPTLKKSQSKYSAEVVAWGLRAGMPNWEPQAAARDNSALGGIALNAKLLDLKIKRDGRGVPLSLSQQPLDEINIQGFVPQIISIKPVDLPTLFGLNS